MGEGRARHGRQGGLIGDGRRTRGNERGDDRGGDRRRALDAQGRRTPLPVGEVRRFPGGQAGRAVRARLVDGVAADVRPDRAWPAGLLGHGLVRAARLRLLVRGHGGLRPLRQEARHLLRHRQRRRRPRRGHRLRCADPRRAQIHGLRHIVGRIARGAVRAAPSGPRRAARARCLRLDRRGRAHAGAEAQEASGIPREQAPARSTARSSIRSSRAIIRTAPSNASSTRSPTPSWRSTTRCPTARTSTCARSCRLSIRR